MAKKTLISDFNFNEFCYDIIFHSSAKDRAKLSEKELREISTDKRAKKYTTKSTFDEKLIMLAKLGCSYSFIVSRTKNLSLAKLKELYKEHLLELSEGTITDTLKSNLFVVGDKNVIYFLNLMGDICHSDTYMLNRDFHRVGHHVLDWGNPESMTHEDVKEVSDCVSIINKLALNTSMLLQQVKGLTKLSDLDLNILMLLFNKRIGNLSRSSVDRYFNPTYKKTLISAALKRLVMGAYIDKGLYSEIPTYSITSLGIDTVMEFHRKNLKDTLSY